MTLWGVFESAQMEDRFRKKHERQDLRQISVVLILAILVALLFLPSDEHVLGHGPVAKLLLAARIGFAALATLVLIFCRRELTPSTRDRALFIFGICSALFMVGIGATRPSMFFLGYMLTEIYVLSLLYFVSPLPLWMKAVLGALFTGSDGYLLITRHRDLDPLLIAAAVAAYLTINAMGMLVSWNVNRLQRKQFAIRQSLEEALRTVKTLRGILSICTHCKKIRSDSGAWELVELYVRDHTHAEFSHGICPDCLKDIYGQEA